jgi:hypothetical protein
VCLVGRVRRQREEVVMAYRRSSRRVFFLDYGGTLSTKEGVVQERLTYLMGMQGRDRPVPLTEEMFATLKELSSDPRNTVFIVSGKEKSVLMEAFGGAASLQPCPLPALLTFGLLVSVCHCESMCLCELW